MAEVVLTIPHSNAHEERIFSLIANILYEFEPRRSSLVTVKTHIDSPLTWEPQPSKAKKVPKSITISIKK